MNISKPILTQNKERITLDLRPLGIPEIPMIGRYNHTYAHHGLGWHSHSGAIEICYLAKGTQLYRLGRRDYLLQGGDVFVTLPGEHHSTGNDPEGKGVLYWLIVNLPKKPSHFLNCPPADSRTLVRQLLGIRHRHFRGLRIFPKLLDEVILASTTKGNPFSRITITTKLTEFLLKIIECARQNPQPTLSPAIHNLLRFIQSNLEEPLTIRDMAGHVGLSVSRLKTRFKQEVGIPPAEYLQRCKVSAAKALLAKRKYTITDIAFRLNFSTSQYFATVFKRYTDQSPRAYLRTLDYTKSEK